MRSGMPESVEMSYPRGGWRHEFEERRLSLLNDGYRELFCVRDRHIFVASLRHPTNKNKVSLRGYPLSHSVEQRTNGLLKYIGSFEF